MSDQAKIAALEELIDQLRPAVQADGGDLYLVSADTNSGKVTVGLTGACSSCAISTVTVQAGVERILKARLPWITEVSGELDSSIGLEESLLMGRGSYIPLSTRER